MTKILPSQKSLRDKNKNTLCAYFINWKNKNIFIHARRTQSIHEVPRIAHKQNTTTVEDILHYIRFWMITLNEGKYN